MDGSEALQLQRELAKPQRALPVVLGCIAALLLVAAALFAVLQLRVPAADPAVVAADAEAWELLKRDDGKSLAQAIAQWEELEAKAPEFVPAKANLMVAYVLMSQDLRDETRRILAQHQQLNKNMERLREKKEPDDWREKVEAIREQMIECKKNYDPKQEQASRYDEKWSELHKVSKSLVEKLGVAGDAATIYRASAIYYASKGEAATEKVADSYRKIADERKVLHDDLRAFADLAVAGRFAQQRITPEELEKGREAAQEALKKDPKLLRARLFLAKMYLANRDYPAAKAEADKLLALNPAHEAAEKLKQEAAEAEEEAKQAAARAAQKDDEQ